MMSRVNKTSPLFQRLITLQTRNLATEREILQSSEDKVGRYEQEIRKLRQKNYGQQIELRAKEFQLSVMANQAEEYEATIEQLRQQLDAATERNKVAVEQEKVYQQRIAAAGERLAELQSICEVTAGTLRRSAGTSGYCTSADGDITDDDSSADKWARLADADAVTMWLCPTTQSPIYFANSISVKIQLNSAFYLFVWYISVFSDAGNMAH